MFQLGLASKLNISNSQERSRPGLSQCELGILQMSKPVVLCFVAAACLSSAGAAKEGLRAALRSGLLKNRAAISPYPGLPPSVRDLFSPYMPPSALAPTPPPTPPPTPAPRPVPSFGNKCNTRLYFQQQREPYTPFFIRKGSQSQPILCYDSVGGSENHEYCLMRCDVAPLMLSSAPLNAPQPAIV